MNAKGYEEFLGNVDDMAAYWVMRLSSPDCTPEDRYACEAWKREDPAHVEAFEKMQRGNAFGDRLLTEPLIRERIEQVHEEVRASFWRRPSTQYGAIAAGIALIFVVAVAVFASRSLSPNRETLVAAKEAYETAIGERSTIGLTDGSTVTLNTNSRIVVDYTESEREIRLVRGQGFFEVAKDVNRPFVVVAGKKRVVALGTAFDVRLDGNSAVHVTLVEGLVDVSAVDAAPSRTSTPESETSTSVQLKPGERLFATARGVSEVTQTDVDEQTSWRTGRVIFRNRPLEDVIEELNRYSVQQLVLDKDDRVQNLLVSGIFHTGRASNFVDALETMHPLEAQRTGRNELTLVWHE